MLIFIPNDLCVFWTQILWGNRHKNTLFQLASVNCSRPKIWIQTSSRITKSIRQNGRVLIENGHKIHLLWFTSSIELFWHQNVWNIMHIWWAANEPSAECFWVVEFFVWLTIYSLYAECHPDFQRISTFWPQLITYIMLPYKQRYAL